MPLLRTYGWILAIIVFCTWGWLWMEDKVSDSAVISVAAQSTPPQQGEKKPVIPKQAIRLRILANSNSAQDQWLKRQVRDAVIAEIGTWAQRPRNIVEARQAIRSRLPLFHTIAERTVRQHGYTYPVKVDFGLVPFPTKLYGDQVYPAGYYEALRITIGKGQGDNWWCVLFPPLCFVDMSNGDAVPQTKEQRLSAMGTNEVLAAPAQESSQSEEKPVQVRSFLWDSLKDFFSGLWDADQ
ncbi:stage II sporulation protein R [Polycladomyces subterraneus]|uniref:Stage II sporulation protein R n=1 Tax=Polycladomyces subterraneus TaxID=1016997 RepID=A0ABT8IJ34_9BACL|nr:stage II sporulation protein R [Polycladomyces subterraneus]MDN4592794.1 stage II sporulation protein R [Polycladomyces subterraneus]